MYCASSLRHVQHARTMILALVTDQPSVAVAANGEDDVGPLDFLESQNVRGPYRSWTTALISSPSLNVPA